MAGRRRKVPMRRVLTVPDPDDLAVERRLVPCPCRPADDAQPVEGCRRCAGLGEVEVIAVVVLKGNSELAVQLAPERAGRLRDMLGDTLR